MPGTEDGLSNRSGGDVAVPIGHSWVGQAIRMERDEMVAFARDFDPQAMHLDETSGAAAAFGGIIASGWHVSALLMRDLVATSPFGDRQILGMGLDEVRWLKPVRAGDTLIAKRIVEGIRLSRTRPGLHIVRTLTIVRNQHEAEVMRFLTAIQLPPVAGGS